MGGNSSTENKNKEKDKILKESIDYKLTNIIKKYGCRIIIYNIISNNTLNPPNDSIDSTQRLEYKYKNGSSSVIKFIKTIYKKDGKPLVNKEIVLLKSKTDEKDIDEYGDHTTLSYSFTIECSIYKNIRSKIVIDTNNKLYNLYILLNWYKTFRESRDTYATTGKPYFNINYIEIYKLFVSILTLTDIEKIDPTKGNIDLEIMKKFLYSYDESYKNNTIFTGWKLKWNTTEVRSCEEAMLGGDINKKRSAKKKSSKKKSAKKRSAKKKSAKKRSAKKK
jgi:hypothetical protein